MDRGHHSPALVRTWAASLSERLLGVQGVIVEDKGPSVAVHYRKSRARREARQAIDEAVRALGGGVRLIDGKLIVNVLPEGAPHNGISILWLRARQRADTALYVGDDVTDEDVFTLDEHGRLLSIRIGRKESSAATYYLRDQREIDTLLEALLSLRAGRV